MRNEEEDASNQICHPRQPRILGHPRCAKILEPPMWTLSRVLSDGVPLSNANRTAFVVLRGWRRKSQDVCEAEIVLYGLVGDWLCTSVCGFTQL